MTPHLRGHVRAYVDRALPPAVLHLYDRHLVACMVCRSAADQERRIVSSLRADACDLPGSLRSSLMSLATAPAVSAPAPIPTHGPRIPLGPLARGGRGIVPAGAPEPLSTVPPTAPALHRSPMRAAVIASLAAGASVAAAWGLAVSPLPGGTGPRTPSVRLPAGVADFGAAVTYRPVLPSLPVATRSEAVTGPGLGVSPPPSSFWVVSTTRSHGAAAKAPVRIFVVSSAQSRP